MFTAFFDLHIPASTIAKPAFMKITRIVATNNHKLSAKKVAACGPVKSPRPGPALAAKVKILRPKSATGTVANQINERLVLKPRMLRRSSIGPSRRLAS